MTKPDPSASSSASDARTREFLALLSQCERRLYSYVFSLVGNFDVAAEIVQETHLRLWEQFEEYRPGTNFGSWACSIAHFQVLSFRNRSGRQGLQLRPEFFELVAAEVNSRAGELESRRRALAVCLETLSEFDREMVLDCHRRGIPVKQVAEKIGRTLTATYQLMWRIRNKLHQCVEQRLQAEES